MEERLVSLFTTLTTDQRLTLIVFGPLSGLEQDISGDYS